MKKGSILVGCACFAFASLGLAEVSELDTAAKSVTRYSTNVSMIGVRDTLVFYVFPEQKAALKVVIGNQSTLFPVSATVYQFAADASKESLEKWLNNQHSDALYIDAAKPVGQFVVPKESCEVVSHKRVEDKQFPNGTFGIHQVEFRIAAFKQDGKFQLKECKDTAMVAVLVKQS